jgi:hypothetical protein
VLTKRDSIIQDCEDALTNWVSQNAAVKPQLSTRARTLSQRRQKGVRHSPGQPVDLASQDQPLGNRESGLWVPASEHQTGALYNQSAADDGTVAAVAAADEDDDDDDDDVAQAHTPTGGSALNGEQQQQLLQRGREEERAVAA